ncbi:hypothetical protein E2C01_017913 [Portunus trituberculatus]|uniref:Uncharacterized protein n=1 Tax=Portunus trituberculatus TaxID=210409 RepID=A0A5B7DTQ3_PORTR|nr:hypothetical protein [Portunus trituberculatus]
MIRKNSSWLISLSPSRSASSIISCSSSSVRFSPRVSATRFRFAKEILPVLSSSNSLKAFRISSLTSFSAILIVMRCRNSSNLILPLSSLSISATIFLISSFFGSNPRALIATLSSLGSMVPVPLGSKRSNASLMSVFCSSVNSNLVLPDRLLPPTLLMDARLYCVVILKAPALSASSTSLHPSAGSKAQANSARVLTVCPCKLIAWLQISRVEELRRGNRKSRRAGGTCSLSANNNNNNNNNNKSPSRICLGNQATTSQHLGTYGILHHLSFLPTMPMTSPASWKVWKTHGNT